MSSDVSRAGRNRDRRRLPALGEVVTDSDRRSEQTAGGGTPTCRWRGRTRRRATQLPHRPPGPAAARRPGRQLRLPSDAPRPRRDGWLQVIAGKMMPTDGHPPAPATRKARHQAQRPPVRSATGRGYRPTSRSPSTAPPHGRRRCEGAGRSLRLLVGVAFPVVCRRDRCAGVDGNAAPGSGCRYALGHSRRVLSHGYRHRMVSYKGKLRAGGQDRRQTRLGAERSVVTPATTPGPGTDWHRPYWCRRSSCTASYHRTGGVPRP